MNRNLIQKKNILLGLTFKSFGIVLNFVLVPVLIFFLGKVEYGVWITVFSITNWIFTFDIGIGHGLRNKLTEALSLKDHDKASKIVSTSYFLISFFALTIFLIGVIIIVFSDFQSILNYKGSTNSYLQSFILLSLFFTVLNFILSLYKKLYLAIHKSYIIELVNLIFQIIYLVLILSWVYLDFSKSLINLIIIYGVINLIVSVAASIIFFKIKKKIPFSYKNFSLKEAKALFSLGGKFFIINISLLVILSTDNVIISNLLGPSHVTDYSIIQKVFQFLIVVFSIVLSSSWGLYSESIIKKDYKWIRENIRKMNFLFIGILIIGTLLYYFIEPILNIWIGKDIVLLPRGLVFYNMLYTFIFCFTNIYMFFINAANKINIQMYLYVIGALINIPLSIYLVNKLGTSTGVIIATIICILPLFIVMPIQTKRILKKLDNNVLDVLNPKTKC